MRHALLVETAIRQPRRGKPVAIMHYIVYDDKAAKKWNNWYDQRALKVEASWLRGRAVVSADTLAFSRRRATSVRRLENLDGQQVTPAQPVAAKQQLIDATTSTREQPHSAAGSAAVAATWVQSTRVQVTATVAQPEGVSISWVVGDVVCAEAAGQVTVHTQRFNLPALQRLQRELVDRVSGPATGSAASPPVFLCRCLRRSLGRAIRTLGKPTRKAKVVPVVVDDALGQTASVPAPIVSEVAAPTSETVEAGPPSTRRVRSSAAAAVARKPAAAAVRPVALCTAAGGLRSVGDCDDGTGAGDTFTPQCCCVFGVTHVSARSGAGRLTAAPTCI